VNVRDAENSTYDRQHVVVWTIGSNTVSDKDHNYQDWI
jgi:hypothetical protein